MNDAARERPGADVPADGILGDIAAIQCVDAIPTILDVLCKATGMGFAAVARVTEQRWIACGIQDDIAFGLEPGGELPLDTTLCRDVRRTGTAIVIDNVAQDPCYRDHPVPARYGFQSYISVPIRLGDGQFFGTLCAIDPEPAKLDNPATIGMFRMFADLIAFHLDADARVTRSETLLLDERGTAELREQFIAVLGHDLRNPLAALSSGVRLLQRDMPREKVAHLLSLMQASADRMAGLIDNVLDLARGRLGGGLKAIRKPTELAPVLLQVVDELRSSHPDRIIDVMLDLPAVILCDRTRIAQLFSNLVGNALTHGSPGQPIRITATVREGSLAITISNGGEQLSEATLSRLFHPFARGAVRPDNAGLGLGLYIASEIAKAHGGMLSAASDPASTCFTFTMPLDPAAG